MVLLLEKYENQKQVVDELKKVNSLLIKNVHQNGCQNGWRSNKY